MLCYAMLLLLHRPYWSVYHSNRPNPTHKVSRNISLGPILILMCNFDRIRFKRGGSNSDILERGIFEAIDNSCIKKQTQRSQEIVHKSTRQGRSQGAMPPIVD